MSDNLPAVPSDIHYEVALDPEPLPVVPELVDPVPSGPALLPVIPAHLQSVAGIKAAAARQVQLHGHRARYHAVRSPRYLLLAVLYALAGAARLVARQLRWWWVLEQHELRSR